MAITSIESSVINTAFSSNETILKKVIIVYHGWKLAYCDGYAE
jgi:hypothetical protein